MRLIFCSSVEREIFKFSIENFPFAIRCEPHLSIRSVFDALPYSDSEHRISNYLSFQTCQIYTYNGGLSPNCYAKTLFVVEILCKINGNRKERNAKKRRTSSAAICYLLHFFISDIKYEHKKLRKLLKFGEV